MPEQVYSENNSENTKESVRLDTTKPVDSDPIIPTNTTTNSTSTSQAATLEIAQQEIVDDSDLETATEKLNESLSSDEDKNTSQSPSNANEQEEQIEVENNLPSSPVDSSKFYAAKEEAKATKVTRESRSNDHSGQSTTLKGIEFIADGKIILPLNETETDKIVERLIAQTDSLVEAKQNKTNQEKQWYFSNGAAFTYGRGFRTLSSRESTQTDYLELRDETETSLDAVRVDLDFRLQNRNGFYLQSGLEYEQINERFDYYNEMDLRETKPDQLLAIYHAMDGSSSDIRGIGKVTTTHWHRRKTYNHYRRIDVPILLGYQSTNKDKRIGWFVEGGVSMNLWFQAKGGIIDSNGERLQLADHANLFKKRTGINLLGAAGLTYKIANKISIWASPEIKSNLNSITSEENALDQKYLNIGLGLGIRYHWQGRRD